MEKDEDGFPIPRKSYIIPGSNNESCYDFAVFPTTEVQKEFPELFAPPSNEDLTAGYNQKDALARLAYNLTGLREFYRGVGRCFGSEPSVRIGKRNIVIRQFRGLDI
jgi:hypothetical protein